MIKFIKEKHQKEFWQLYPTLQLIIMDIVVFCEENFSKDVIPTSIYRPFNGKKHSVHNVYRGFDFRSRIFTKEEINAILDYVNDKYIYDPLRPNYKVAIFHNVGYGWHFHIQCHPRTRRREGNGQRKIVDYFK